MRHFPHIEGLRAVAVLSVILYHLSSKYLPGGFIGVDVFFVISGFVISNSLDGRRYSSFLNFAGYFYTRRIARIIPVLIVCLLVTTLFSVLFIPGVTVDDEIARAGVFAFLGLSNIALTTTVDAYFGGNYAPNPFLHTWSLGVEEQFYLLFPFLFYPWVCNKTTVTSTRNVWLSVGLLASGLLVSLLFATQYTKTEPQFAFYSVLTRFWELATGVLLYQFYSATADRTVSEKLRGIIGYSSALLLLAGFTFADKNQFPLPWALLPVAGTAGLIYCLLAGTIPRGFSLVQRALTCAPAGYIGRLSYSLYLWHWPVFTLARWTIGLDTIALKLGALLLIVMLSICSYHLIERPWKARGAQGGNTILFGLASVLLAAVIANALFTHKQDLSLSVAGKKSNWYPGTETLDNVRHGECQSEFQWGAFSAREPDNALTYPTRIYTSNCKTGSGPNRTVFALGDSHAWVYGRLFRSVATLFPMTFATYEHPGCPFPDSAAKQTVYLPVCSRFHQAAVQEILAISKPGDILFLPGARINNMPYQWRANRPPTQELGSAYDIGIIRWQEALAPFLAKGLHIILEQPKPVFGFDAHRCSDWFNASNRHCRWPSTVSKATFLQYAEPIIATMSAFAAEDPRVFLWNPTPLVCPGTICSALVAESNLDDGFRPVMWDYNHLSTEMLERLYEPFIKQLETVIATE